MHRFLFMPPRACSSMLTKIPARYLTIIFFAVSYALLYFLYAWFDFLPDWDAYGRVFLTGVPSNGYLFIDPLFLGIPIVGFAFMWIAIRWALSTFENDQILSIPFALLFVASSYVAFFVASLMFYWNNGYLVFIAQGNASPLIASLGFTIDFVLKNFLDQILQSPFFVFVLSALLGWVSFILVHRVLTHESAHHASSAHHSK